MTKQFAIRIVNIRDRISKADCDKLAQNEFIEASTRSRAAHFNKSCVVGGEPQQGLLPSCFIIASTVVAMRRGFPPFLETHQYSVGNHSVINVTTRKGKTYAMLFCNVRMPDKGSKLFTDGGLNGEFMILEKITYTLHPAWMTIGGFEKTFCEEMLDLNVICMSPSAIKGLPKEIRVSGVLSTKTGTKKILPNHAYIITDQNDLNGNWVLQNPYGGVPYEDKTGITFEISPDSLPTLTDIQFIFSAIEMNSEPSEGYNLVLNKSNETINVKGILLQPGRNAVVRNPQRNPFLAYMPSGKPSSTPNGSIQNKDPMQSGCGPPACDAVECELPYRFKDEYISCVEWAVNLFKDEGKNFVTFATEGINEAKTRTGVRMYMTWSKFYTPGRSSMTHLVGKMTHEDKTYMISPETNGIKCYEWPQDNFENVPLFLSSETHSMQSASMIETELGKFVVCNPNNSCLLEVAMDEVCNIDEDPSISRMLIYNDVPTTYMPFTSNPRWVAIFLMQGWKDKAVHSISQNKMSALLNSFQDLNMNSIPKSALMCLMRKIKWKCPSDGLVRLFGKRDHDAISDDEFKSILTEENCYELLELQSVRSVLWTRFLEIINERKLTCTGEDTADSELKKQMQRKDDEGLFVFSQELLDKLHCNVQVHQTVTKRQNEYLKEHKMMINDGVLVCHPGCKPTQKLVNLVFSYIANSSSESEVTESAENLKKCGMTPSRIFPTEPGYLERIFDSTEQLPNPALAPDKYGNSPYDSFRARTEKHDVVLWTRTVPKKILGLTANCCKTRDFQIYSTLSEAESDMCKEYPKVVLKSKMEGAVIMGGLFSDYDILDELQPRVVYTLTKLITDDYEQKDEVELNFKLYLRKQAAENTSETVFPNSYEVPEIELSHLPIKIGIPIQTRFHTGCPVCLGTSSEFLPCGHACCKTCYNQLPRKNCPFCRFEFKQLNENFRVEKGRLLKSNGDVVPKDSEMMVLTSLACGCQLATRWRKAFDIIFDKHGKFWETDDEKDLVVELLQGDLKISPFLGMDYSDAGFMMWTMENVDVCAYLGMCCGNSKLLRGICTNSKFLSFSTYQEVMIQAVLNKNLRMLIEGWIDNELSRQSDSESISFYCYIMVLMGRTNEIKNNVKAKDRFIELAKSGALKDPNKIFDLFEKVSTTVSDACVSYICQFRSASLISSIRNLVKKKRNHRRTPGITPRPREVLNGARYELPFLSLGEKSERFPTSVRIDLNNSKKWSDSFSIRKMPADGNCYYWALGDNGLRRTLRRLYSILPDGALKRKLPEYFPENSWGGDELSPAMAHIIGRDIVTVQSPTITPQICQCHPDLIRGDPIILKMNGNHYDVFEKTRKNPDDKMRKLKLCAMRHNYDPELDHQNKYGLVTDSFVFTDQPRDGRDCHITHLLPNNHDLKTRLNQCLGKHVGHSPQRHAFVHHKDNYECLVSGQATSAEYVKAVGGFVIGWPFQNDFDANVVVINTMMICDGETVSEYRHSVIEHLPEICAHITGRCQDFCTLMPVDVLIQGNLNTDLTQLEEQSIIDNIGTIRGTLYPDLNQI